MKVPATVWVVAHAVMALAALRIAESLVTSSFLAGITLGILGGGLIITLLSAVRYFASSGDISAWDMREYLSLIHRLPRPADYAGTIAACVIWFAIASSPLVTLFKAFWLVAALLTSRALVRRYSYRN